MTSNKYSYRPAVRKRPEPVIGEPGFVALVIRFEGDGTGAIVFEKFFREEHIARRIAKSKTKEYAAASDCPFDVSQRRSRSKLIADSRRKARAAAAIRGAADAIDTLANIVEADGANAKEQAAEFFGKWQPLLAKAEEQAAAKAERKADLNRLIAYREFTRTRESLDYID